VRLAGTYEAQGFCVACWEHCLFKRRPHGPLKCPLCGGLIQDADKPRNYDADDPARPAPRPPRES
jgi:PHP family Zn ribbon phosphoesterase